MKTARTRKLVGMAFLLTCLGVYALAGVYIAVEYLPDNRFVELVYYAVVGIAWAFPAKYLLIWIYAPDADVPQDVDI